MGKQAVEQRKDFHDLLGEILTQTSSQSRIQLEEKRVHPEMHVTKTHQKGNFGVNIGRFTDVSRFDKATGIARATVDAVLHSHQH